MSNDQLGTLLLALVGALLVFLGWRIAFQQRGDLIAGWNEEAITNPRAFMAWLGGSAILFGLSFFACAGLVLVGRGGLGAAVVVTGGVIFVATLLGSSMKYGK